MQALAALLFVLSWAPTLDVPLGFDSLGAVMVSTAVVGLATIVVGWQLSAREQRAFVRYRLNTD